jgi:8-oxo-dGTP pyrophosphatase MutT (NUDIX family)
MKYQAPESHIHNIARCLLVHGEEVILCRVKNEKWFFLPGGHIEDGESARTTLLRELREELGNNEYKITSFVGVCESIFLLEEGVSQHEIDIVFKVDVPSGFKINTTEEHIEFVSVKKKDLKDFKILPTTLKEGLLEWLENEKPFFKEA